MVLRRRSAPLLLLLLSVWVSSTLALDAVHANMEAASKRPKPPRLRSPFGSTVKGGGLVGIIARVASPKRAIALLPAMLLAMAAFFPEQLARLLIHAVCFIGSLLEPYDTMLPEQSPLRFFTKSVQNAKKAYDVKHGLVQIDEQKFFDEDDFDELSGAEVTRDEDDEAEDEEEDGGGDDGDDDEYDDDDDGYDDDDDDDDDDD